MNKKIAIFSAAMALTVPIMPVFAQVADLAIKPDGVGQGQPREKRLAEDTTATTTDLQTRRRVAQEKRLEFQAKKEKMTEDRCQNIQKRLESRINRYQNTGQMLQKVYGNMKTRLARLSAKLKAAGVDTTKLDADLLTLSGKIDTLFADQAAFMTTLQTTDSTACTATEADIKTQIENARKVPEKIKQDRADIKNFFQTTIKADLQAIMTKLGGTLESTEPAETTEAVEVNGTDGVEIKKEKSNKKTVVNGTTSTSSSTSTTSTSTTTAE